MFVCYIQTFISATPKQSDKLTLEENNSKITFSFFQVQYRPFETVDSVENLKTGRLFPSNGHEFIVQNHLA